MQALNFECSEIEKYVNEVKTRYEAIQKQMSELNREKVSTLVNQNMYQMYLIRSNSLRSTRRKTGNLRSSGDGSSLEQE